MWKYVVLRLGYLLFGRLPLPALYAIAHIVGDGAYLFRRTARRGVLANMRQVMGPEVDERAVRRAAREVFRNGTRYYADLYHTPHLDPLEFLQRRLDVEGLEHFEAARDSGRGAVVVSAHFGNPEIAIQGLATLGFSLYGLTEELHPKRLSDFTQWLRSHHGHEYRTVSFGAVKEAIRRVRAGGFVAILLDRDVRGTGVPMQLCGAETRVPLGAVDLALRTGGVLIPAWTRRIEGYRFEVRIEPPLEPIRTGSFDEDVRANAQRLLTLFEARLKKDPGQWAVLEGIFTPADETESSAG
ncbi:MAG: lysophospholipid acyltransferase family protein [Chloroflexi bacterium]|nr:lysophospholipid acyltransferase family protein [Chloroflexota bacterium]